MTKLQQHGHKHNIMNTCLDLFTQHDNITIAQTQTHHYEHLLRLIHTASIVNLFYPDVIWGLLHPDLIWGLLQFINGKYAWLTHNRTTSLLSSPVRHCPDEVEQCSFDFEHYSTVSIGVRILKSDCLLQMPFRHFFSSACTELLSPP